MDQGRPFSFANDPTIRQRQKNRNTPGISRNTLEYLDKSSYSPKLMNEARQAAYFNLIKSLANCPSGEETDILAANLELVDAGLVEMMHQVAAQQEDETVANWLEDMASQLAEGLNLTEEEPLPVDEAGWEERFRFLMEVLQATSDSNTNPEVIYPLLAANTDKLDDAFAAILQHWATTTLAEAETDRAISIAADIGNFSKLIQQFPLGSKASNMEIAIAGYEVAATVFTRTAFPEYWATLQNNLGNAYLYRIQEDKADNLEKAIASYTAALTIYIPTAFPQNYVETAFNLGLAYKNKRDFNAAYQTFADAINTLERIRLEIISGEEIKQKQSEEWNKLYREVVEVCIELE